MREQLFPLRSIRRSVRERRLIIRKYNHKIASIGSTNGAASQETQGPSLLTALVAKATIFNPAASRSAPLYGRRQALTTPPSLL